MRFIFLVALVFSLALPAAARCASASAWAQPEPGTELPANGKIWLVAFGAYESLFMELAEKEAFVLERDGETIPLDVQVRAGEVRVTGLWLTPTKTPTPGTWRLISLISDKPISSLEKMRWTFTAERDEVKPTWTSASEMVKTSYKRFGCGPAINLAFAVPVSGARLVEVKGSYTLPSGEKHALPSFLFPVEKGAASVGHGMCSGGHRPVFGARYEVELIAYDDAGNASKSPFQDRLTFTPVAPSP